MSPGFRHVALQRAARVVDLMLVSITFLVAFAVSSGSFTWENLAEVLGVRIKVINFLLFAGYLLLCSAMFSSCGFYLSHRLSGWSRRVREICLATTLITAVLLIFRMALATNEFLILFWLFTSLVLVLGRAVAHTVLYFARSQGRNLRNIIVVGEGKDATALAERIEKETTLGYRVVQVIKAEET